jgi:hypothetical protein
MKMTGKKENKKNIRKNKCKALKKKACFLSTLIILILLLSISSFSAEPEFRLDIDNLNLQKGVSTSLKVLIINTNEGEVKRIDGLENFEIMSSQQSISTSIVNGKTTVKKEINYTIMPMQTGEYKLQGIIEHKGKEYKTNILTVNVSENKGGIEGEQEEVFVKTVISEDEVFFGQKLILTYELYTRYNIDDMGFPEGITVDGFIQNDIETDSRRGEYVYVEGAKYARFTAKQIILLPTGTGKFAIPSYKFQVNLSTGGFFSSSKPVYLMTEPKEIEIKPVPVANRPKDFSNIVGDLHIETEYSRKEVEFGDSLTLRVKASGNCNLEELRGIIKDGIPGFSVYETERDLKAGLVDGKYKAEKEFEIILVPEKNGELEIKPISINYFNPDTMKYEKAVINGAEINVTGEMPEKAIDNTENIKTETININKVSYNIPNEGYINLEIKKKTLVTVLIIILIIMMLSAGTLIFIKHKNANDSYLSRIYKKIKKSENQNEIYSLFNDMIKHSFNISIKAASLKEIKTTLDKHNMSEQVIEIIEYIEKENQRNDIEYLKDKITVIYIQTINKEIKQA